MRGESFVQKAFSELQVLDYANTIAISVVSIGELMSLAKQRNWAEAKQHQIETFVEQFLIIPIESKDLLVRYADIDAYSQGKLVNKPLPKNVSARNMGKNDLWIAATASITESILLTTDKDFEHLDHIYLTLKCLMIG